MIVARAIRMIPPAMAHLLYAALLKAVAVRLVAGRGIRRRQLRSGTEGGRYEIWNHGNRFVASRVYPVESHGSDRLELDLGSVSDVDNGIAGTDFMYHYQNKKGVTV